MCNPSYGYFDSGGSANDIQIAKKLQNAPSGLRNFKDAFAFDIESVDGSGKGLYLFASPISLEGYESDDATPLTSTISYAIQGNLTVGDYVFKVTERVPRMPEFKSGYDASSYYLKATVNQPITFGTADGYSKLADGAITIQAFRNESCTDPIDSPTFTNPYTKPTFGDIEIQGAKTVLGRDGKSETPPSQNSYRFTLVAAEGSPVPTDEQLSAVGAERVPGDDRAFICKNDGRKILFPAIGAEGYGPYAYTVFENETDEKNYPGITYDIAVVEVYDRMVEGVPAFKASISYVNAANGESEAQALFKACLPVSFTMVGEKRPTDRESVGDGEFTYRVSALDDNSPMPVGVTGREYTCTVNADRSIDYQPITFYSPGRYVYGVQEVPDPGNLVDYDETSYVVVVDVELVASPAGGACSTRVSSATYVSDRLGSDGRYEMNPEVEIIDPKAPGTVFKDHESPRLYQGSVDSNVPRHDWTGGVINRSTQFWCAAPVGQTVTVKVPAEFEVSGLPEGVELQGAEGGPRTFTWESKEGATQITWFATPVGVSDIKVVKTEIYSGTETSGAADDSLQYAIYHVNGSVADEYQASIAEHTESKVTTYEETEVRRTETPGKAGDQANWRSTGDAYRNAAGSEVTTSYMSDCTRWSEGSDDYDAAERTKAHLEVQGATVEEPVLIPTYVFTVCVAHNFSRDICEENIYNLLTDYGICIIKGVDGTGKTHDSFVAYMSSEGNNSSEWMSYLNGLHFEVDEHFTNVLPIAIKEVLFGSFAARSDRASLVHDTCAIYTSFDCTPEYSMIGTANDAKSAWRNFNTWVIAKNAFWNYLADRYTAGETYFSLSEKGASEHGTAPIRVLRRDWEFWDGAPAFASGNDVGIRYLQADKVGRISLMDPANYVNCHQSRKMASFGALYPYSSTIAECNIEPVEGTLAMEAVVRDGFTVTHIRAEHDDFVVEANVVGDPTGGYKLTPTGDRTSQGADTKTIEAKNGVGEVKLRLVLDGQKAIVYALGHDADDPENIRLNIDADVDHEKIPAGEWLDVYAENPRLTWTGQQIIDIQPPILSIVGTDLTIEKVQVIGDATSDGTVTGDNPWTKDTLQLDPTGTLSYSFKLENKGKVAATDVYIEDYLPEELTLSADTIKAIEAQGEDGKESFWIAEERHFKYYVADKIAAATEGVDGALTPTELDLTAGEHPFVIVTTLPDTENAVYANSATATANELPDPVESNTVIATTGSHVEWGPFAEKEMKTGVLQKGQFSFRLWTEGKSAETLAPMPLGATTTTDGAGGTTSEITVRNGAPAKGKGRVDFGTIVFTEAKTYTYYLQEVVPSGAKADTAFDGVTYDTAVYEVKVAVSAGGDDGYKIDSIDVSEVVAPEAASSPTHKSEAESLATFANSATGSLEISKQVVGTKDQQGREFTFDIQLSGVGSESLTQKFSGVQFTNGKATVKLHHGESKLIEGLPAGMGYTVKETSGDAGFTMTSTNSVGSIPVGGTAKAAFTNIAKGALTITKVVKGTTNPGDLTRKFSFTITLSDIPVDSGFMAGEHGGLTFSDAGDGTFTATCELADGGSVTATGLPEGAHYLVEEVDATGYAARLTNAEGEIPETGFVSVQATNTKEAGNLVVYKTVPTLDAKVPGVNPSDQSFEITVTLDRAGFSGEYGDFTFVNGKASVTLASGEQKVARGLPAGIGYTVTEAAADGYTTKYRGETGEIRAGETERTTVTNSITTGSLRVSKTVANEDGALTNDELAQTFTFAVRLFKPTAEETKGSLATEINGSYPGTYPGSGGVKFEGGVATFSLKHGESVTINQLPPGYLYEVKETGQEGYTTASTGSEGQIPANGTATASFVNTHGEPTTASLVVRKTVTGTVAPGTKFKFTVTLTKDGKPLTGTYGGYVFNESGQTELELQGGEEAVITGIPAGSHYTVTETRNETAGDYTVTKKGDTGDLKASDVASASFTNNFITTGNLSITKKVEGLATGESAWEFTIELTGNGAESVTGDFSGVQFTAGKATVSVESGGTKLISGLPAGLHYKVEETGAEGYTTTYGNAEGEIPSGGTAAVTCTNTKTVPLTPQVQKQVVDGKDEVVGDWDYSISPFTFTLASDSNAPLPSGTEALTQETNANGIATWPEITYREAGTYTYQVRETAGALAGMDYDKNAHTLTVEVAADGTITQKWDGKSATPTITNTYAPTGSLKITKTLAGENTDVDEDKLWNFTITLTKADESPLSGTFDGVEFGTDGEAIVQLKGGESREIKGIPAGARYTVVEKEANEAPYTTTSVGAKGSIQTGKTAEAAFTNTKAAADLITPLVKIEKTIKGEGASISGHKFVFEVKPDSSNDPKTDPLKGETKVVETKGTPDPSGNGKTETVTLFYESDFGAAGTYTYTVSEVRGTDPAISYDDREFTVTVTITEGTYDKDLNVRELLASVIVADAKTGEELVTGGSGSPVKEVQVRFENTYDINEITVPLKAHKTLEGEGMELEAGEFAFELAAQGGAPLPGGAGPVQAKNNTNGDVVFDGITFTAPGTYKYEVSEVVPDDSGKASNMTYDESVWDVTVEVTGDTTSGLSASVTYAKRGAEPAVANSDAAEFKNTYEPPTPPPPPDGGTPALAVSKTHGLNDDAFEHSHTLVNEVAGGDVVTYFVKVENTGSARATGVTVRDVVPEGLELVGNSISEGGSIGSDGRTITWSLGTLGAGESRVVSFGARVPAVDAETTWTNVASAWAEEVPDPKATNVVMEHATPPENPPDEPDNPDNPPDTPSNPGTPDTPSTPDTPGNPGTPGAPSEPKSPEMAIPKTGDDTPLTLALLLGVAGVSLLAATLALLLRRRRT